MKTIDNSMLGGVTGGTTRTTASALNDTTLNRPELHALNKLGRQINKLATSQQSDQSNTALMLCCAMLASRRS